MKKKMNAGYAEGIASVVVNCLLFALKMWAGVVSASSALVADAWHTLSDSISSIVVIGAVKLSGQKPDKEHPFGHGRWEHIAALFVGFFLAVVAYNFVMEGVEKLQSRTEANYGLVAIIVTIISILVKEGLAQYAFRLAKSSGNLSIKADGWHHRSDALSSVVVLAGIFCAPYVWWVDGALTIVVALMLFHAAYTIVRECVDKLLGEVPSAELMAQIEKVAKNSYAGDLQLHHLHVHNYVSHKEMTMHIKLPAEMTIEESHLIATQIENAIWQQLQIMVTTHVEPLSYEHEND